MGVLAASHELNKLGFELFKDLDEDFIVFSGVTSEIEDLPIGQECLNWHPDALAEKVGEVRTMEAAYSEVVREGCKRLLTRFGRYAAG